MRIGPVLEVTTSFRHFTYGIEIRIWSAGQDNSQSWVRISFGTIQFKTTQRFLWIHKKSKCHKQVSRVVAARSKAKAKPQPRESTGTTTIPEVPEDQPEEQALQLKVKDFTARSKAKAKPQPRVLVGTTATIPMHERRWVDIEPSKQNLASYDLSKKVISLLRHSQTLQREEDGAIEFYKIKFHLRNHSSQVQHWSDERWILFGSRRRIQTNISVLL